ncbi:MAG: DUF4411 family protein [Gammaproteobacteria bacterium]|nr:DUF4411 family protein [Gammaproteobacteria bacterium]MDA7970521.1 DUF4411 family protein [Gammaproteobacteria bacterium]MDA7994789.1 DUF4411 family protein [Gammaproteobacteria bacterium]MDA8024177.1 DUF4411 family protein [Gammaproteobacteria bacterium]CAJ2376376.1 MAG: putative PilT domain-containing protein [Arenicellales bacterium IbO2]
MFVLDTSAFIHIAKANAAPGVWQALLAQAKAEKIRSIDRVKKEWRARGAFLKRVKSRFPFVSTKSLEGGDSYNEIAKRAKKMGYTQNAREEFFDVADGWLVAYAHDHGYVVVTNEKSEPDKMGQIKIPDMCEKLSVRCIDPQQMAKELDITLP